MNYAQYMRKVAKSQATLIGFQNGQDASQVTVKARAKANTVQTPIAVSTSFSKIGGTVSNITQTEQQTSFPTNQTCASGYSGVSQGYSTVDSQASVIGASEHCSICADTPSWNPRPVEIPCSTYSYTDNSGNIVTKSNCFIPPVFNSPGVSNSKCCVKDHGIKFYDNKELVADQGLQATLRRSYNLPNKLQGLRGPIVYY